MGPITIVSGCPGSGKTTLARELAARSARGLHLESDTFYRFPAEPLDPTSAAAHAQNTSIMRALGRAAGAFAEDDYAVFLDGVIGPWFLPVLVRELPAGSAIEYVVLRVELARALERVRARQGRGASATVEHVHRALAQSSVPERCVLDTSRLSPSEVLEECLAHRARGDFRLLREALAVPR